MVIRWRDVESLLHQVGAEVQPLSGVRFRVTKDHVESILSRPHHHRNKLVKQGLVPTCGSFWHGRGDAVVGQGVLNAARVIARRTRRSSNQRATPRRCTRNSNGACFQVHTFPSADYPKAHGAEISRWTSREPTFADDNSWPGSPVPSISRLLSFERRGISVKVSLLTCQRSHAVGHHRTLTTGCSLASHLATLTLATACR